MATKKILEFNFEAALKKLETIVNEMEQGGLPLDLALKKFEEGVKLTRECQKTLSMAEQKVKILTEKDFAAREIDKSLDDE